MKAKLLINLNVAISNIRSESACEVELNENVGKALGYLNCIYDSKLISSIQYSILSQRIVVEKLTYYYDLYLPDYPERVRVAFLNKLEANNVSFEDLTEGQGVDYYDETNCFFSSKDAFLLHWMDEVDCNKADAEMQFTEMIDKKELVKTSDGYVWIDYI